MFIQVRTSDRIFPKVSIFLVFVAATVLHTCVFHAAYNYSLTVENDISRRENEVEKFLSQLAEHVTKVESIFKQKSVTVKDVVSLVVQVAIAIEEVEQHMTLRFQGIERELNNTKSRQLWGTGLTFLASSSTCYFIGPWCGPFMASSWLIWNQYTVVEEMLGRAKESMLHNQASIEKWIKLYEFHVRLWVTTQDKAPFQLCKMTAPDLKFCFVLKPRT